MVAFKFIIVTIVILSVLLVLIVLSQNPKGGGLSSAIGGGSGSQMFGVQQTNKFLVNSTWFLAVAIAVLAIVSSRFITSAGESIINSEEQLPLREDQNGLEGGLSPSTPSSPQETPNPGAPRENQPLESPE